jgi:hypothetical protein
MFPFHIGILCIDFFRVSLFSVQNPCRWAEPTLRTSKQYLFAKPSTPWHALNALISYFEIVCIYPLWKVRLQEKRVACRYVACSHFVFGDLIRRPPVFLANLLWKLAQVPQIHRWRNRFPMGFRRSVTAHVILGVATVAAEYHFERN